MNSQPRVLHLSSLTLSRGGIESFLVSITKGLSAHYNMLIVSSGGWGFQERISSMGGRTSTWFVKSALDKRAYQKLLGLLQQEHPSLVHIHDSRAGWIGRLALLFRNIPVIMTPHLPSYYYRWDKFSNVRRDFYSIVESGLNHLATTKVIYPSLSGYQYAMDRKIVPASKAVCIPNGIDVNSFSTSLSARNAFRKQMGLDPGQIVVCALGRLSIEKNFSLLIDAFTLLHTKHPHAHLWIVGDGPEKRNLVSQTAASKSGGNIHFLEGDLDVQLILSASDIFALSSWYEGGRTLAVMEAQASGKPCVVSNVGDLPLMVEDGVHGFVFEKGNIIACAEVLNKLLSDKSLCEELGNAAYTKAVQEYDVRRMIHEYEQIYDSLL